MRFCSVIALFTLGLACFMAMSAVLAQVRVRVVPGENSPESEEESGEDDRPAVEGVEPTEEERARIEDLIAELGAPSLARRDRAMNELAAFKARALGQVRAAREHDDDEIAHRCTILEEVIESGQGELFLAARRLDLSIGELQEYLASDDVSRLLLILRTRAQPGMVPLWSMVLARLSGRNQLLPAAVICREVEGSMGYGEAAALACSAKESDGNARALHRMIVLLPPGDPRDAVEALTRIRFLGSGGIDDSLGGARALRGLYGAAESLAARDGRPGRDDELPEGAASVRAALALVMTESCPADDLTDADLPPFDAMSPLLLSEWLALAGRSGHDGLVADALSSLREEGADPRRISMAAAAWGSTAPVEGILDEFDGLPFTAQLAVMDALRLNPREPRLLQPWLIDMLGHQDVGLRREAARQLGQYRARSTVEALVGALDDALLAPTALEALRPMADLLSADELAGLADSLPDAGVDTRTLLVEVLAAAGNEDAHRALLAEWKRHLPRNELAIALMVLARDASTPAGAYAAAVTEGANQSERSLRDYLMRSADSDELETLRALLARQDGPGFALLQKTIAAEIDARTRIHAMTALALAGRDDALIDDWIKRHAGEITDPAAGAIGLPIAMSSTQSASEFRRNALQQGGDSADIRWVIRSMLAGRTTSVTREELSEVLFASARDAAEWVSDWPALSRILTRDEAPTAAAALVSGDQSALLRRPATALLLRSHDVDILAAMYGDSENPAPSRPPEILLTALMGDVGRAGTILAGIEPAEDGSNFLEVAVASAWLARDGDGRRLAQAAASEASGAFGVLWRMERAGEGDVRALRGLLDAWGAKALHFRPGSTATVELVEQRWGGIQVRVEGVAEAGVEPETELSTMDGGQLAPLFADTPPREWRDWWACRRALVEYNEAAGRYRFVELP